MKISFLKIFFVLMFGIFCFSPLMVSASSTDSMSGWAWSSNIGWISFNCTNDSSCATSDYGVNKNADGTLTGYAWSSNIGWIKFGGFIISDFPTNGTGTQQINAKINGNNLQGWAKALSGGDGSSGWDGWISFSGTTPNYGVSLTGDNFSGYAWGSEVVGWVDFSGVIIGAAVPAMSGTLTPAISSCIIASGTSSCPINLSWSIINPVGTPTAITASGMTNVNVTNTLTTPQSGGPTAFTVPWGGRTFYLYNNGILLAESVVSASSVTCAIGTSWNGTICTATLVNGSCSSPATHYTCNSGTSENNLDNGSVYTWDCMGSNGGMDELGCSEDKSFSGVGCSSPMIHYKCADNSDGANQKASPSKWTWTCGNGFATSFCSEKKSPGYIEN
ncbi:MAG: hypothetical protein WC671_01465 [Candidatus Paceibacterota bacterium]|jgi:hypothetical protein